MIASIDPLISELRIWVNDDAKHGDPFKIGCLVRWISKTKIQIRLLDKKITKESWDAVMKDCRRLGIKRIFAIRYRKGKKTKKWINVKECSCDWEI